MTEIISFAKTNFRNQQVQFGIKQDDRRRHFYAIGKTGMGKTNMLENMAIQDIRNGHGICFIDPHGDTAEKLISMMPSDRLEDVIYFNPADQNFPIAFNVMERVESEFRPLIASGLIGVFKKLWADSWGPRLEYILRNAILALLEYPGSTLLGVMRILVDKGYRKRVVDKITDPVVRSFWVDEFPKWSEKQIQEVISPIQNKVGQFLTSPIVRNIIGQTKSTFDVRSVMDSKKILILNLAKGRIGEDNSALIGAMIVTKIQLAAMERVDMAEDLRNDFYLYVDEFQNFATDSFASILSEARKYRLNLILANQYISQLDEKVRDAVFGNVGTMVSFRVGAADAEFLEKEFEPVFTMNDIVNLPKYGIYLKLMIDGITGDAFSATTLPPIERFEDDSTEKVIQLSRQKYATPKAEAEEKIARLTGVLSDKELIKLFAKKGLSENKNNSNPVVENTQNSSKITQEKQQVQSNNLNVQKSNALKQLVDESRLDFEDKDENYAEFVYLENKKLEDLKKSVYGENGLEDLEKNSQNFSENENNYIDSQNKFSENNFSFVNREVSNISSENQDHQKLEMENVIANSSAFNSNFDTENNGSKNLNSIARIEEELVRESDENVVNQNVEVEKDKSLVGNDLVEKSLKSESKPELKSENEIDKTENKTKNLIQNQNEQLVADNQNKITIKQDEVSNEKDFKKEEIKILDLLTSSVKAENELESKISFKEDNLNEIKQEQSQNLLKESENKILNTTETDFGKLNSEENLAEKETEEIEERPVVVKQEKQIFKANCSTCDEEIEIPFQPDGVRPVFCRECLKDYQRAVAKAKLEEEMKNAEDNPESQNNSHNFSEKPKNKKKKKKRNFNNSNSNYQDNGHKKPVRSFGGSIQEDVFVSKEKPLSMSQIPYIAPKKFSDVKPSIDFAGVREMIKKAQGE